MNPISVSKNVFRAAVVLSLAVAIGWGPGRLQANDKKDDKKVTPSGGNSNNRNVTPPRPHNQAPVVRPAQPAPHVVQHPVQPHPQGIHPNPSAGQTPHPQGISGGPHGSGISGTVHPNNGNGPVHSQGISGGPHGGGVSGTVHTSTGYGSVHSSGASGGPHNGGAVAGALNPGGPVFHSRPGFQTTRARDGSQTHFDPRTRSTFHTDPGGHVRSFERPGLRAANFRPDGRAGHIEHSRPDGSRMIVDRGFHGERRVEVIRPGNVRVVAYGRRGFVERPFRRGYVSRTYIVGGRPRVVVYRSYGYRGVRYVTYVPRVYYRPAFYGWAVRPWGPRVVYAWGWGPAPWFYGGYFAPSPYYPTPSLWLTDYLLAENLRLNYENQQLLAQQQQQPQDEAPPEAAQGGGVPLTPEIKQEIAEEVRRQLAADQGAAAQPGAPAVPSQDTSDVPPPALTQRVFVVSSSLDVTATDGGQSCALSAGDIIERTPGQHPTDDGKVPVDVMSSKAGDCPAEFTTLVDVATLQDMQNQFREQLSSGMEALANNQGKNGLPTGPAAAPTPNSDGQAAPDPDAQNLIASLGQQADQTEAEVRQAAAGGQ